MDSLEEAKLQLLGGIEEDDDSYIESIVEEMRPYRKAWHVHGLASRRNITVFTPKIGSEAKPLIPVPITEDDDFEKLTKEYGPELREYAQQFVYRNRESEEVVKDIVQQSWMDAYHFMKKKRWHPISAAVFGHLSQVPSARKEGQKRKSKRM
jgi:hypothetical protein